jgi:lipoprotein-anchoring transpeptidase ErfK/SrfK
MSNTESLRKRIVVNLERQELELRDAAGRVTGRWPVSTSKFGYGTEEGTYRTPTGRFRVSDKIGEGCQAGEVLKGRVPTGVIGDPADARDLVETRILWLDGLEEHNANTKQRYIYIHGTNHEDTVGTPASQGCVRMRNADVMQLFDLVQEGDEVVIA